MKVMVFTKDYYGNDSNGVLQKVQGRCVMDVDSDIIPRIGEEISIGDGGTADRVIRVIYNLKHNYALVTIDNEDINNYYLTVPWRKMD